MLLYRTWLVYWLAACSSIVRIAEYNSLEPPWQIGRFDSQPYSTRQVRGYDAHHLKSMHLTSTVQNYTENVIISRPYHIIRGFTLL